VLQIGWTPRSQNGKRVACNVRRLPLVDATLTSRLALPTITSSRPFSSFEFISRPVSIFLSLGLERLSDPCFLALSETFIRFYTWQTWPQQQYFPDYESAFFKAACSRNLRNHPVLVKVELHSRDLLSSFPCMDSSFATPYLYFLAPIVSSRCRFSI
jgi:hypothetical protein